MGETQSVPQNPAKLPMECPLLHALFVNTSPLSNHLWVCDARSYELIHRMKQNDDAKPGLQVWHFVAIVPISVWIVSRRFLLSSTTRFHSFAALNWTLFLEW